MSDPAPLPRLGEVFFDVRGNSRSMRLSWYADTGVAVFSIWQAGMCTGTFRLPMADLGRMIEILQRGPAPRGRGRAPVSPARPGEERGSDSDWYYGPGGDEQARRGAAGDQGGYGGEQTAEYGRSSNAEDYGRSERGAADYGQADYGPADYGAGGYGHAGHGGGADADFDPAGYERAGDYGQAGYGGDRGDDARYHRGGYGSAGQQSGGDYRAQGYEADYALDEFAEGAGYQHGYEQVGYEQAGYEQAGYGPGGHPGAESDYRTGEYPGYPEPRRAVSDRDFAETDGSGYRDERFVAPYVADDGQTYAHDNPARGTGHHGDIGDAAYPADRRSVSRRDRYLEPSAADEAYSYGAEYRNR